jgi:predicted nucleic acid-binding Zn ribbon protein
MRRGNDYSLKEALQQLVESYRLRPKLQEALLIESWEELVGPAVSRRTMELKIKGDTLQIRVNSSVLREELHFSKAKIMQLVNEKLGANVIREVTLT